MARRPEQVPELSSAHVAAVHTISDLSRVLRALRRREARLRGGAELTFRQMAGRTGWSHAVIAAYLSGRTLPPTDRFDTLIQLLGATAAEQHALATARDRVEEGRRVASGRGRRTPTPRQLPGDVAGFVGRAEQLAELDRLLSRGHRTRTTLMAVVGAAGVGKTALAVHWAHWVRRRFPHGQLYVDLGGHGPASPLPPGQALDAFLASLGVATSGLPPDLDARSARFRSLLHGRRLLIVLDNAAHPQQVRPLLPAAPGCLVLVTSRDALTGLVAHDRACRMTLDVLPMDEAVALLAGFVGRARVAAEPAATRQVAHLCDRLPVALCAAGVRAAASPSTTLASFAAELAVAERRLDMLDTGGDRRTAVRAVLSWSYRRLRPAPARLFRLLARHQGGDIDPHAAAELAGTDPDRAGRLLDQLAAAHLLQRVRPGRYRVPGLVRAYAAERAFRSQRLRDSRRPPMSGRTGA
jgi:transcriptional regulator with XRE-family HTH domain